MKMSNSQTSKSTLLDPVGLNEGDIARAALILSRAFQKNPLMEYFVPDKSRRIDVLPEIMKFVVRSGLVCGRIYTSSDNLEGIAVCLPSESSDLSLWQILRVKGVLLTIIKHGKVFGKLLSYESFSSKVRDRLAPSKHWYLNVIGIDPVHQGKGFGGILLRSMFNHVDKEQLPCYLETHEEATVSMYQHYGFEVVGTGAVPCSEVRYWAMLRNAQ